MSIDVILISIIILWSVVYTVSYGVWTWKHNNKLGGSILFVLAAAVIVLPIYSIYFRH